jgi:hypothetical protein
VANPGAQARGWYNVPMPEYLNQLLADGATALVGASFTGVVAPWWWERRVGGGIEVCQEFDPELASREISTRTGHEVSEVRRAIAEELGLEDEEPVVLTFEIAGETETDRVAAMLAERSSEPEGLASGLYRRIEEIVEAD